MLEIKYYQFPFVEVRCPQPVLADHSILSVTGNDRMYGRTLIRTSETQNVGATSYKIGALVKYRCERGYKVVGDPLSTCEDTGKWSGDVPQCVCKCLRFVHLLSSRILSNYEQTWISFRRWLRCPGETGEWQGDSCVQRNVLRSVGIVQLRE